MYGSMGFPSDGSMFFNRYLSGGDFSELTEFFRYAGEPVVYVAGGLFAEQGCRNRWCGLVEQGALRYVHCSDSGDRHTVGYAFAGEFVGDYISMCNGAPSWVSIEAMDDCEVLRADCGRLEGFYRTDASHEQLGRRIAELLLSEVYERMLQLYAYSPQERYESLLRRCPSLLNVVSLKELASYLRVRPETLSRIRGRVR